MSLSSIALQTLGHSQHPLMTDPRLQVNAGNRPPFFSTMFKVGATTAALFVSIGSFFLLAPIVAFVVTVVSCGTAGLFWLFDSCCGGSRSHGHSHHHDDGHVEVGGGHRGWGFPFFGRQEEEDHVEVGGGHRGWGFPFFGGGAGGDHVEVGGHRRDHVEVGGGHTGDHVQVGGGHRVWSW